MAVIKSGDSSDHLTVDATSNAIRTVEFDSSAQNRGVKATYKAATATNVTVPNAATMFFVIAGGPKTMIIQRIIVSGGTLGAAAVAYASYVVEKWSIPPTGGTATPLVEIPVRPTYGASVASICQVYTAAPTEGTLVGTVACRRVLLQSSTASGDSPPSSVEFDFRSNNSENTGIYLRTSNQALSLAFGAAPGSTVTLGVQVEWVQE